MDQIVQTIIDFFAFPPTTTEYIVFGMFLIAFFYQLYYYIRYMSAMNRRMRRQKKGKVKLSTRKPPVSVIVCGRNEEENLKVFLPSLLTQDYPEYEVIVVDDSSEDGTRNYLKQMSTLNSRMHYTFVPKGPYMLSTKKLAITLGIKAAKYEHLLFTDADCYPHNEHWISSMIASFTEGTEIVVGYGAYERKNTHINRLISYDTLWNAMQYIGQASSHHPYMGVGRNLAYTKTLFFRNKGFAGHLCVLAGDDDLFVNRAATRRNTNIAVGLDATTWSVPKTSLIDWLDQKRRHVGVSKYYRFGTKLRLLFEPLSRGILYATFILTFVLCRPYIWACAIALMLARFIWHLSIMNVTAKKLCHAKFHVNIIWFDIILPIVNLLMIAVTRFSAKKRNRW